MVRVNSVRPSPSGPIKNENAPAEAEAFKEFAGPRANSGVPGLSDSVLRVLQARDFVFRLMEIDAEVAAGGAPDSERRAEWMIVYEEAWRLLHASGPSIIRDNFPSLFGIEIRKFECALTALGWRLMSEAQRAQLAHHTLVFPSPAELRQ